LKAKKLDRIVDEFINDPDKQPNEFETELDGLTDEIDKKASLEQFGESGEVKDLIKSIDKSAAKLKKI
jgi:hypothetical protein